MLQAISEFDMPTAHMVFQTLSALLHHCFSLPDFFWAPRPSFDVEGVPEARGGRLESVWV